MICDKEDLAYLMSVPRGRSFLWSLLGECRVFSGNYSPDHSLMSFNEGARNVGLQLFILITTEHPNDYLLMAQEAEEKRKIEESKNEHTEHDTDY